MAAVAQQEALVNGSLQASWRAQPMWNSCTPQQPDSCRHGQQEPNQHAAALPPSDGVMSELVNYRSQLLQVKYWLLGSCNPLDCTEHATW